MSVGVIVYHDSGNMKQKVMRSPESNKDTVSPILILESPGIDPGASRMLSERSTI